MWIALLRCRARASSYTLPRADEVVRLHSATNRFAPPSQLRKQLGEVAPPVEPRVRSCSRPAHRQSTMVADVGYRSVCLPVVAFHSWRMPRFSRAVLFLLKPFQL